MWLKQIGNYKKMLRDTEDSKRKSPILLVRKRPLETGGWSLDEAKIEEAARYDAYYAVVTNNLELDNAKRM